MAGGIADRVGEQVDSRPGRGLGVGPVWAIDPYDGMEVQGAALLEFGDLPVRDACVVGEFAAGKSGAGGDLAAQASGEALPQVACVVVEEDGARVVVRRRVERCTEGGVVGMVAGAAAADALVGAVVDGAEGRGGQGGEDAGVVANGGGDVAVVVSRQAHADEVVGVSGVRPGAGRAAGGAAVAAGDPETSARLVLGGVVVQGLAGGLVLVEGPAGQVDRGGAAAGTANLVFPTGVVGGRSHPQQVAEGGRVEQRVRRPCNACATSSARRPRLPRSSRIAKPTAPHQAQVARATAPPWDTAQLL